MPITPQDTARCIAGLLLTGVVLLVAAISPPAAKAGCGAIELGGRDFIFSKQGVSCQNAKRLARQTYETNKAPSGWKCPDASPGKSRRDGANCFKTEDHTKVYGYHLPD